VDILRRILFAAFVVGLGLSITLSQSALAALTALWLWRLRDPGVRRAQAWPFLAPVLAFAGVTLLSALLSGELALSLTASKGLLLMAALYVTADGLDDVGSAGRFLTLLSAVLAIAAGIGLLQVAVCPGPGADAGTPAWLYHRCHRARGPFSIYMTLAGILTLTLLATLPRLLPGAPRRPWFLPLWLIMLGGLIASYTRGAWLGFAAGVLALLPASRRGRLILVGGLAALVLGLLAGPPGLRHRFVSMGDPEEATVKERRYMWESGLMMARVRPWLGFGPGGVKREYRRFSLEEAHKKRTGHVHNTPLQILVERGAIGLAAWLWIWVAFYAYAIGVLRRLAPDAVAARTVVIGSLAAITGFLVGGLSEYNFGDSEVVMVAWAIAALPSVVARDPAATASEAALSTLRTARSTTGL
jgi:O-antigen ligase